MQKFQRFIADQRWDLPQYKGMKQFIEEEFQAYAKLFVTPTPKVVQNWVIENAGGLIARVNQSIDSTLLATARPANEDFYRHLTTDDPLTITLPDSILSFVEVQIFEKVCADDTVAIWDTTANSGTGAEFSQSVDLVTAQDFRLVSNTIAFTGDADKLPLAEVTTAGGIITLIDTTSRNMLYDSIDHVFGAPRTDRTIGNMKAAYDAVTTILKEIKRTPEWYTEFVDLEYDAIVGASGTHATLAAATAAATAGFKILVRDADAAVAAVASVTVDDVEIVFHPGAKYTAGVATEVLSITGDRCRVRNGRFDSFTTAIDILAAANATMIRDNFFVANTTDVADAGTLTSELGNISE